MFVKTLPAEIRMRQILKTTNNNYTISDIFNHKGKIISKVIGQTITVSLDREDVINNVIPLRVAFFGNNRHQNREITIFLDNPIDQIVWFKQLPFRREHIYVNIFYAQV